MFDENFGVCGVREVWRQLRREGVDVARCTVARLMKGMGLQGVVRGKRVRTPIPDPLTPCPLDRVNRQFKIPWAVDRDRRSGSVGLLRHPSAQETAMNKPLPAIFTPAAIRTDLGAIFVSLELSRSRWIVTSLSPGGAEMMSKHSVPGGDLAGLMERFRLLVAKAKGRTGRDFPIVTIQEAASTASGSTARW